MESGSDSVFSSFKTALLERAKSPLAGTLFISWSTVNWKILYILIWSDSTLPTKSRLELINSLDLLDNNWNLYYTPLILSFSYLLLYPWVGMGIKVVKRWYYEIDKKLQEKLFKNHLLTYEESERVREDARRIRAKSDKEILDLKNENVELKLQLGNTDIDKINNKNLFIPDSKLSSKDTKKLLKNFQTFLDIKGSDIGLLRHAIDDSELRGLEYAGIIRFDIVGNLGRSGPTNTIIDNYELSEKGNQLKSFITEYEKFPDNVISLDISRLSVDSIKFINEYSEIKRNRKRLDDFITIVRILNKDSALSLVDSILIDKLIHEGIIFLSSPSPEYYSLTPKGELLYELYKSDRDF